LLLFGTDTSPFNAPDILQEGASNKKFFSLLVLAACLFERNACGKGENRFNFIAMEPLSFVASHVQDPNGFHTFADHIKRADT